MSINKKMDNQNLWYSHTTAIILSSKNEWATERGNPMGDSYGNSMHFYCCCVYEGVYSYRNSLTVPCGLYILLCIPTNPKNSNSKLFKRYTLQSTRRNIGLNWRMEKDIPCKSNRKKPGLAISVSDIVDFPTKSIIKYKDILRNDKRVNSPVRRKHHAPNNLALQLFKEKCYRIQRRNM